MSALDFVPGRASPLRGAVARVLAIAASPAIAVFLSNNIANAGNLAYNMVFSRWLGPEMFGALATLLTLKLSLLALLNALQLATSQRVSANDGPGLYGTLRRLDKRLFLALAAAALILIPFAASGHLTGALGLPGGTAGALAILLLALPVTAPLCLERGVALGRLNARGIVASGQAEMAVRFLGGIVAWHAGWGLAGVTAALALSLVAGWIPVRNGLSGPRAEPSRDEFGLLMRIALPFAALQLAQVMLMDGDVVVSTLLLGPTDAGLMAVLALFQRIQFYALFGLAGVLLPAVSAAVARGDRGLAEIRPVVALYLGLTLPLLGLMYLVPAQMIGLVAGPSFAGASAELFQTGLAAAFFTASYLGTTLLAAWGDRRGLMLVAAAVPVQLLAYFVAARVMPEFGLANLVAIKLCVQAVLAAGVMGLVALRLSGIGALAAPERRA